MPWWRNKEGRSLDRPFLLSPDWKPPLVEGWYGMGAREKYRALPQRSRTTFTWGGENASAGFLNGCAAVTKPTLGSARNSSTSLSIKRGSIRGSSPWIL